MRKYRIDAKRRNTNECWSGWSRASTWDEAVATSEKCVHYYGYSARIVEEKTEEVLLVLRGGSDD